MGCRALPSAHFAPFCPFCPFPKPQTPPAATVPLTTCAHPLPADGQGLKPPKEPLNPTPGTAAVSRVQAWLHAPKTQRLPAPGCSLLTLMPVIRRQLWRALRLSMPACILNPGKAVLDLKAHAALLFEAAEPSKFQGYKTTLWPLSPPNIVIMSCFIRLLAPRAMAEYCGRRHMQRMNNGTARLHEGTLRVLSIFTIITVMTNQYTYRIS